MNIKQAADEIRARADIVEIISAYVQLKKRGKNFLGLCPFHSEKTPSFNASQEKGLFHCFGCGEGGNVFDFIMKIERVDFVEAVKILGDKLGLAVDAGHADPKIKDAQSRLYEINQAAADFFESRLDQSCKDYLKARGLKDNTIKNFRLGFAPDSWDNLFKHLIGRGYSEDDLLALGLIIKKEGSRDYFDRFRNRIMFPVFDLRGRICGFSGRAQKNVEPKYLNSPDSPIFHKGGMLFGLNFAAEDIKKKKYALLVEGNVDLLLCHQYGYKNTAAPMGTAFGAEQAKLLKRLTDAVIIAFDSDSAGIAAAEKADAILKAAEIKVRIANLGGKKDPADFLSSMGGEEFFNILKESKPALEQKILNAVKRFNLAQVEGRALAIEKTAEVLSVESNPVLQKEYAGFAVKLLGCDPDTLASEIKRRSFYGRRTGSFKARQSVQKPAQKTVEAEKYIIGAVFENSELAQIVQSRLSPEDFSDPLNRRIMEQFYLNPELKPEELESEEQKKIVRARLMAPEPETVRMPALLDCANTLKLSRLKSEEESLRGKMKKEEEKGNLDGLKKLQEDFLKLREISRNIGSINV